MASATVPPSAPSEQPRRPIPRTVDLPGALFTKDRLLNALTALSTYAMWAARDPHVFREPESHDAEALCWLIDAVEHQAHVFVEAVGMIPVPGCDEPYVSGSPDRCEKCNVTLPGSEAQP